MSGPSKVIVLDPDPRAGRQVQLGFAREGVDVVIAPVPDDPSKLVLPNTESTLVLIGGTDGVAVDLVRRMRQLLSESSVDIPIVFTGSGAKRGELEQAGADEVVLRPAYLRDVVTIGRLMSGVPAAQRGHLVGSLVETTGVYTLVRALSALGRSAVLTLVRGLRRGEVRFCKGEVTSAQVGLIHGQAALHQLLLWTDARFDFHHEDNIVHRHQIPMSPDELFADAERFLEGVRDSAGQLSPAMVLEQDVARIHNLGTQVPTEVHGVLRMFDGHRVLADVLEDSPYRVFETLRVAQKAMEAGLLKPIDGHKAKATWRTLLTIEEWLVGSETRDAIVERTSKLDSGRVSGSKKKKRKKQRLNTPPGTPAVVTKPDIDWGDLVPRIVGAEVGQLAGVVPAQRASGEIVVATRETKREGLEALMDTDKREKIFPTDIGVEPSVVWNEEADRERANQEQAARDTQLRDAADAAARETAEREAKAREAADAAARETAERETKAREQAAAAAAAAAELAAVQARTEAAREATKIEIDRTIRARATAEQQRERDEAQARVKEAVERQRLEREAAEKQAALEAEREAKLSAARREAETSMAAVKAALEARTRADEARKKPAEERPTVAPAAAELADAETDATKPFKRAEPEPEATALDDSVTAPIVKAEPETSNATMLVKQLVADGITQDAKAADAMGATSPVAVSNPPPSSGTPIASEDDPSDGVVQAMIATADTARLAAARARRPSTNPPDGEIGPPEKEKTGEIREPPKRTTLEPATSEPSILVTDIAVAHATMSAAFAAQVTAAPTPDAASPSRELLVSETRKDAKDAIAASEAEEAFFRKADASHPHIRPVHSDSFEDLDEGYEPPKFWDRVLGRRKRPSTHPPLGKGPTKK